MERYWMWLLYQKKILPAQQKKCMEYFQTPKNMFIASSKEIEGLTFLSAPAREELLKNRTEEELQREETELQRKNIQFISMEHPLYPQNLRSLSDAPGGLFLKGHLPILKEDKKTLKVAIVGARWASHGGLLIAKRTAKALAERGITVVSGMASGIDCAAQEEAMKEAGKSIAVLGCGVDICYPADNQFLYQSLNGQGLLVSEYPPGTAPAAFRFPLRNRIISGMADVVLVVEARKKSGSLITADYALEQGKDVYAVPGRIDDPLSEGCNRLIREGAGIYCSLEEFLLELGIEQKKDEKTRNHKFMLAKSENIVYSCLDFHGKNPEEIAKLTNLSHSEVLESLLSLELKDLIEERARYYFRK